MKTLITSSGNTSSSLFDLRFARAAWFCIYDEENKEAEFIKNENINAKGGAGNKAVEKVVALGIQKIISGDFGPNVKNMLENHEIQMVILKNNNLTVQDIINKIR